MKSGRERCCRSRPSEVGFVLIDEMPEVLAPDQRQEHHQLACFSPGEVGGDTAKEGAVAGIGGGEGLDPRAGKGQAAGAGDGRATTPIRPACTVTTPPTNSCTALATL